jgi:membrane protease YdiL (CAAX protease family)
MPEKLVSRDYRFIVICAVVAVVSLVSTARYFYVAFPEASITFAVTRDESTPLAETFLQQRGLAVQDYRHAVIFDYDDLIKVFLEKEMGLEQANQLLGSKIKLWRWSHRWFRPLQKEELQVDVTPQGEVVRFAHPVREEESGATLTPEAARTKAEAFLTEVMRKDLAALEFIEATSQQRPHRRDHAFTWKDRGFSFRDASYRFEVTVQGDQIGGYREFLKVPEAWTREYEQLRSLNDVANRVASAAFILLCLAMLVVMVQRIRWKDIRWPTAGLFGAGAAALGFFADLNSFPLAEFGYDTTESYGSFLTETIITSFFSALGLGAFIFLVTVAAEPLYRQRYKNQISLTNLFSRRGLRTKRFFLGVVLGLTMTAFFVAYQIVFYLAANKFGAWAPADVPYSDLLNTHFPWIFVLLGGFFPAVSEEFVFRMFSIPFLEKLFKSGWVALVLAGFTWGFGHAGYPQQPFYIRGVEVGIAGIIIGLIMIRFGILAPLIWHYTVDAVYTALLMIRSENLYYAITGGVTALIFLIPLLVSLIAYLRSGTFESEEELTNEREGTAAIEPEAAVEIEPAAPPAYTPLSRRRILVGLIAVGVLLSLYLVPVRKIGEFVDYKITGSQAREIADAFLKSKGVDPGAFQSVEFTSDNFDPQAAKYILLHKDVETLNRLFSEHIKSGLWVVRYFKPLEKEEYRVSVDPRTQSVHTFEHTIDEKAPGADLDQAAALNITTAFLGSQAINMAEFEMVDHSTEKRPARRDHSFVWQAKKGDPRNIGDATFRLRVLVQGDEVARFQRFLKLPEDWTREREKSTVLTTVRDWVRIIVIAAFIVVGIIAFVTRARHGQIRWKQAIKGALVVTGISLLGQLNELSLMYADYDTTYSTGIFMVGKLVGVIVYLALVFVLAAFVIGLMMSLYPEALAALRQPNRRQFAGDALIISVLAIGAILGVGRLGQLLFLKRLHEHLVVSDFPVPSHLDTAWPFLSHLVTMVQGGGAVLAIIGLVVYIAKQYMKNSLVFGLALVVAVVTLASSEAKTLGEYLLGLASLGLLVTMAVILVRWVLRENWLAYFVSLLLFLCPQYGYSLATQSATFYRINGLILFGIAAGVVVWLVMSQRREVRPSLSEARSS